MIKFNMGWGILITLLGILAILAASFTTWISVMTLGALLMIAGVIFLANAIRCRVSHIHGALWYLTLGLVYGGFGLFCLVNPIMAATSFTLFLAIFFIFIGVSRIVYSQSFKFSGWGWSFFSGILSVLLGILIIMEWPASGLFIIGLFIGIDLLFLGWSYIIISMLSRSVASNR